jgi:hypothetical protein
VRFIVLAYLLTFSSLKGQQLNYYFGNLHAHTAFSDGNKDSSQTGVFSPAGSFAYAKASSDFDFLGISEHNHYSSARNPGFRRPLYQRGLEMADSANEDGKFLALYGMEYGVSANYCGHVLVYGFDKLLGWENSVPGLTGVNYDIYNAKSDYDGLFRKVLERPGSFCYLAHPNFDDFSTAGNETTALAYAPYNAAYDSAIVGMPLRSGLATTPGDTYSDYPLGNYFIYYKRLLYQGYHLGIGYDHDNHYTNFGRGNGGRLAILATSLTRASLFQAMKQMNFYGTDDANARIRFELDGKMMGSILTGTYHPTLQVVHDDADGENADTIRIWKGHRNSGGLWAEILHTTVHNNTTTYTDYDIHAGIEYYYFAEIRQQDGQWIVTSPVWYTPEGMVGVRKNGRSAAFTVFPNPVSRQLSVSHNATGHAKFSIMEMNGRTVLEKEGAANAFTVDLQRFARGIYIAQLETGERTIQQKIILE